MGDKLHILIAEDESIVARDIKENLEAFGYDVCSIVLCGEDAIQSAAEHRPDLVLMDITLQGSVDGIEATRQIREELDIPVVYLTAHADDATFQRAKLTDAFGYILKPFEERELHINVEIALRKHALERQLRESEQWLATTLTCIGDAVIVTDLEGRIKFMNPVSEALTGWSQAESLGRELTSVFTVLDEELPLLTRDLVARVLSGQGKSHAASHSMLQTRDGASILIDHTAALIKDGKGDVYGLVLVFRDITERKQAEESLRQLNAELQARNTELDAFAHTVAHDLKTPLGPIVGFAHVLEQEYTTLPDEEIRRYLRTITQKGHKMANIIDELLLLASVSKMDEVKPVPLDMARIVTEARLRLTDMIDEFDATLVAPDIWPVALGYGPWVEEVWVNYISNAIKYGGRPPYVELGATFAASSKVKEGYVRLWVRDNGLGIAPRDQDKLFDLFTRLDQVSIEGHGLGLSIVRRIVERLGGRVGVESQVGQGSVFSFTLRAADLGKKA